MEKFKFKVKIWVEQQGKMLKVFPRKKEEVMLEEEVEGKFELAHVLAKAIIGVYGCENAVKIISNEAVSHDRGEEMIMALQEVRNFLLEAHSED